MSRDQGEAGIPFARLQQVVADHMSAPRADLTLPVFGDRNERLLGILEGMRAWICEFDGSGRVVFASGQAESIIGFTPEECLASDCLQFHPDDLPSVIAAGRKVRETGETARSIARVRHKRGHWVWTETSLVGWSSPEGEFHTISFSRDITELRNAEAARRESDARYRIVSQMSCDVIFETDETGLLTYVGPGCEEVVGYSAAEMLALPPYALMHPDDVERVGGQLQEEFQDPGDPHPDDDQRKRRRRLMEYRIRHQDGRWLSFETLGLTYTKADGELRYLAVARDVTEQRRAEQERRELEEGMQRAQRLESLGVMAGGIAHDFNNLLTPILGAARLGMDELPEDSPLRARLRMIEHAARRAAALTHQMLAYAGQRALGFERIDLSKLVGDMHELLLPSAISPRATLDVRLEPELPPVEVEAAQLGQVVMNLITNAAESLGDGVGHIAVRTGMVNVAAPPSGALFAETMTSGEHVFFEVSDTGCGMDAETRERIFDPFYTTKFTGRGLGLAAVAGIVRGHRGAIEVESEPGRGTRFRVLLPAAPGAPPAEVPEGIPVDGWRTTGTALVIDDDAGVRELAGDVLRRIGMQVLSAADGAEGVALFEKHADSIRVVLLDRTMPVSSGADTFEAIRERCPDAKIVLVSGYSEDEATAELANRGLAGFLKKPFLPETLVKRVRGALGGDPGAGSDRPPSGAR